MTRRREAYVPEGKVDPENQRGILVLPGDDGNSEGRIVTYRLAPRFAVLGIDIRSRSLPFLAKDDPPGSTLKVNCCMQGRCELELHNGGYIYLAGGEMAIDSGQAKSSFHYPQARYAGVEIVVDAECLDRYPLDLFGSKVFALSAIHDRCTAEECSVIGAMSSLVDEAARRLYASISEGAKRDLVALRANELVWAIAQAPVEGRPPKRSYCTATQVAIAKCVHDEVAGDLATRVSAREFAQRFGISETSLKNYFRNVYGMGFAAYQSEARMQAAARLLATTDKRISDVALSVGFASQSKFGAAFRKRYGTSPLEYRREARLRYE